MTVKSQSSTQLTRRNPKPPPPKLVSPDLTRSASLGPTLSFSSKSPTVPDFTPSDLTPGDTPLFSDEISPLSPMSEEYLPNTKMPYPYPPGTNWSLGEAFRKLGGDESLDNESLPNRHPPKLGMREGPSGQAPFVGKTTSPSPFPPEHQVARHLAGPTGEPRPEDSKLCQSCWLVRGSLFCLQCKSFSCGPCAVALHQAFAPG
eukprot:GHVN01070317.1.p1 GENE.GHVN01070317.1~~GHVN01070317.1.p1  ORF type:complete len:218 (+),score=16.30 GHVN01070317.1:48-656(+)